MQRDRAALPKAGNGRPPIGLEFMLRMYFIQHWFNLADMARQELDVAHGGDASKQWLRRRQEARTR